MPLRVAKKERAGGTVSEWKSLGAGSKGDEKGGSGFGMMAPARDPCSSLSCIPRCHDRFQLSRGFYCLKKSSCSCTRK